MQQMRLTQPMQQPTTTQTLKEAARQAAPERFAPELQHIQNFTQPQFINKFPQTEVKAESKTETKPAKKKLTTQTNTNKFTETMFAMAGDALDNLTFGLTDKLTNHIKQYIHNNHKHTPQKKQTTQLFNIIKYLKTNTNTYQTTKKLTKQITKQLPKLADDATTKILTQTNASPITAATTQITTQNTKQTTKHTLTKTTTKTIFQTPFKATEAMYGTNNQTIGQRLGDIAESAALGAILDPIAESYIGAVGNILRRTPNTAQQTQTTETATQSTTHTFKPTHTHIIKQPSLNQIITKIKPTIIKHITPPLKNPQKLTQ